MVSPIVTTKLNCDLPAHLVQCLKHNILCVSASNYLRVNIYLASRMSEFFVEDITLVFRTFPSQVTGSESIKTNSTNNWPLVLENYVIIIGK